MTDGVGVARDTSRAGRTVRLVASFLAAATIFASCSSGSASSTGRSSPTTTAGSTMEQPPSAKGRYGVGIETITGAASAAGLTMDVWYPTRRADGADGVDASDDLLGVPISFAGVRRDAQPVGGGPFPLVVFSHGSDMMRFESWSLLAALASNGYVVVAPDHSGNTIADIVAGKGKAADEVAKTRPADVSHAIDDVLRRSGDASDRLHDLIDKAHIAVIGRSFGGFTALAAAGGYGSIAADPRVDAVAGIAASARRLTDADLKAVRVPTLLLAGSDDHTVPPSEAIDRPWSLLGAHDVWRVEVEGAAHNSFSDVCGIDDELQRSKLPAALLSAVHGAVAGDCVASLPAATTHRVTVLVTLAFLDATIGGEPAAARFLTPAYATKARLPVHVEHR